ncbi:hypothetical protein MHAE_19736 [Mycobacterium haemophilum DSM 44634]|uniref:hypothetical protein n=1 Tax=Mycobacterium haemophilum TaxID=29311 RepID=UPI003AFF6A02
MFKPKVADEEIRVVEQASPRPRSVFVDPPEEDLQPAEPEWGLPPDLQESRLRELQAMRARPDGMAEVSAKMVEIAHQISDSKCQEKAPAVTKIPAPGKDSASALLARFF